MNAISKSALKAKMLGYFRKIEKTGEPLIVTDNHRPVLKIVPYRAKQSFDELFGDMRGRMKHTVPLEESTQEEWEGFR